MSGGNLGHRGYTDGRLLSNALCSLNRRIDEGREFPDALESARLQWGLTDEQVKRLTAMYDAMHSAPPLPPSVRDVSYITEYGMTQKLSNAVRVF